MLQRYKILTVTHHTTSLKNIGQFAIPGADQEQITLQLDAIKEQFALEELYYVATCNRVLFLFVGEMALSDNFVERFFRLVNPQLADTPIASAVSALTGIEVIRHFFKVGASVDSLVVGERQILGQLREAFEQAQKRQHIGDYLRLLFQRMVGASKAVYGNTRIGEKPVSIASLAVRKLLSYHLPVGARILLVGAGQTNTLVGKFLLKHHYQHVTVFNRTLHRAEQLAEKFTGQAFELHQLATYQQGFDCIIVCTSATDPVITPDVYASLLHGESVAEKIIVDLAVPHNTAPEVLQQFPVNYIEIEGLRQLAQENRAFRKHELTLAKDLLNEHIDAFPVYFQQRLLEVAMRQVPTEIKAVRAKAVNEIFRKDIEQLDDSARSVLEEVLSYMEKKCIGIPMRVARESLIP
ncbi:MAG: glutamyl-tRNA reductase [Bacteroidetes bacterium]|nr:MAG: glutamyl-tRNA reductase [Bacteroidota bacterium]PTM12224.1 MAG: glutamyl-tRNA reductase [Bacteroidota bacterium]